MNKIIKLGVLLVVVFSMVRVIDLNRNIFNGNNNTGIEQNIGTNNQNYITDIYNKNLSSVVTVVNLKEMSIIDFFQFGIRPSNNDGPVEQGSGSGFIYKEENGYYYVATNYHVVDGSDELEVVIKLADSEEPLTIKGEFIGASKNDDVAVLRFKSEKHLQPVTLGDSDNVYTGENVVAIGSPYGKEFQGTVTQGIVSAPMRALDMDDQQQTFIQTDAAINSGNSGGPLFNANGYVIGMNTLKISDGSTDNMAFAIPINRVISIIEEIETKFVN